MDVERQDQDDDEAEGPGEEDEAPHVQAYLWLGVV